MGNRGSNKQTNKQINANTAQWGSITKKTERTDWGMTNRR